MTYCPLFAHLTVCRCHQLVPTCHHCSSSGDGGRVYYVCTLVCSLQSCISHISDTINEKRNFFVSRCMLQLCSLPINMVYESLLASASQHFYDLMSMTQLAFRPKPSQPASQPASLLTRTPFPSPFRESPRADSLSGPACMKN